MKPLRIGEAAEVELRAAISWYEKERPGLGDELWTEVQQALRLIADHPEAGGNVGRIQVRGVIRRLPVRRFPYFIVYRDHPDFLEVVAFAH